jgi:hypothetical protein
MSSTAKEEIEEIDKLSRNSQGEDHKGGEQGISVEINKEDLKDINVDDTENCHLQDDKLLEKDSMNINSSYLLIQDQAHIVNNMSSVGEEDLLAKIDKEAVNISDKISPKLKIFNKYENISEEDLKQLLKDKK